MDREARKIFILTVVFLFIVSSWQLLLGRRLRSA